MAARLYEPLPSAEELAAVGLRMEDVVDNSDVWVLPDNWLPFLIFDDACTQWVVAGMGGTPVGLNYQALPILMDLHKVKDEDRMDVFQSLRVMENEALHVMNR